MYGACTWTLCIPRRSRSMVITTLCRRLQARRAGIGFPSAATQTELRVRAAAGKLMSTACFLFSLLCRPVTLGIFPAPPPLAAARSAALPSLAPAWPQRRACRSSPRASASSFLRRLHGTLGPLPIGSPHPSSTVRARAGGSAGARSNFMISRSPEITVIWKHNVCFNCWVA